MNPFSRISETDTERQELIQALDAGNAGNLTVGKVIHNRMKKGAPVHHLEAWLRNQGKKLPEKSARSKFATAYESWIVNAGLEIGSVYESTKFTDDAGAPIPMTLTGVSTYALYEARNLVDRYNPADSLAFVYNHTIEEIKDIANDRNNSREPNEGFRSLPKVPESVMVLFKDLEAVFPGKSRLEVVEFMIQFVHDLQRSNPDVFNQAVGAYFGEEEEV